MKATGFQVRFDTPQGLAPLTSLVYANSKLLIEAEVGGARSTSSAWYRDGRIIGEYEGGGVDGILEESRQIADDKAGHLTFRD